MRNRTIYIVVLAAVALVGCDEQRDLYIKSGPMIQATGDWNPSLGRTDMTMDATAVAYDASGLAAKEYFFNPTTVTIPVDRDTYDVVLFNGLMYSANDTHLDNIWFRGIDKLDTFEAVAREGALIKRLGTRSGENEYIASNDMEIITSAVERQDVDASRSYYIKYRNGENGFDTPKDYIYSELDMTPVAMSYEAQLVVTVKNISSAYSASAALYGFVGSAFMASRMPSHFYVSHHFNLNNKKMIDTPKDVGTIESPVFVTFGPPLDAPDNKYEVLVKITLINGEDFDVPIFDVTDQLADVIEAIKENQTGGGTTQYRLEIPVTIEVDLPIVDPVEGSIGLDKWGDEEEIRVPVPKP